MQGKRERGEDDAGESRCRENAVQDLKREAIAKQEEQKFLNDQCSRDCLETIRKFDVARKRTDEREAKKKWSLSS